MNGPVFIGDEVTAAGYRLAGVRTLIADPGSAAAAFDVALETSDLVLLTAEVAAGIPDTRLDEAIRAATPLVLLVPDAADRAEPPDLDAQVDRVLGIEA